METMINMTDNSPMRALIADESLNIYINDSNQIRELIQTDRFESFIEGAVTNVQNCPTPISHIKVALKTEEDDYTYEVISSLKKNLPGSVSSKKLSSILSNFIKHNLSIIAHLTKENGELSVLKTDASSYSNTSNQSQNVSLSARLVTTLWTSDKADQQQTTYTLFVFGVHYGTCVSDKLTFYSFYEAKKYLYELFDLI